MKATSASVIIRCRYRHDNVMSGSLTARSPERKSFLPISFDFLLLLLFAQAMRRQGGTAWTELGSPPASSTCSS